MPPREQQKRATEIHALDQHAIFDLQRKPDQQQRSHPLRDKPIGTRHGGEQQRPRPNHQGVVEDRRLPAFALHEVQPQDVQNRGQNRPELIHMAARGPIDAERGRRDEKPCQQLVLNEPLTP